MKPEAVARMLRTQAAALRVQADTLETEAAAVLAPEPAPEPKPVELEMTQQELCRALRCSRYTVYVRRRSDPTFPRPVAAHNGTLRFVRAEVEAWLAGRKRVEVRRAS